MTPPTPSELQAMRERCERATPGPWSTETNEKSGLVFVRGLRKDDRARSDGTGDLATIYGSELLDDRMFPVMNPTDVANADFIAHAREDVPSLLAACEAQQQEIERLDKECRRLSGGLIAINQAKSSIPAAVLRGIAYDVALNCITPDIAEYQIEARAHLSAKGDENDAV